MSQPTAKFKSTLLPGQPFTSHGITVQPLSHSLSWIDQFFGLVWNRPYAVRVTRGEETAQIPIRDHTRIWLTVLWGLTAFFTLLTIVQNRKERSK